MFCIFVVVDIISSGYQFDEKRACQPEKYKFS